MAFNHYAKIKAILQQQRLGRYTRRIDEPTTAKSFSGKTKTYGHYYRIYSHDQQPIKYCKFQQLDRLANTLHTDIADLPLVD